MTPPPRAPRPGSDDLLPSKRARAVMAFSGIWLIGTGITLLFAHHTQNPFDAFTSRVPLVAIPAVVGAYAAALAAGWAAVPRFKSEFLEEWSFIGVTIGGGIFAPHTLSFIAGLLP